MFFDTLFRFLASGMCGCRRGRLVTSTLVAREFVEWAKTDEPPRDLTVLKLIALTYLAHGRSFAELGEGLVDESVMAWPYGPAFRDLYGVVRTFGHYPVTNVAESRLEREYSHTKLTANEMKVIKSVYDDFRDASEEDLITQSQEPGTPWHRIWEGKIDPANQKVIDDRYTGLYFSGMKAAERPNGTKLRECI